MVKVIRRKLSLRKKSSSSGRRRLTKTFKPFQPVRNVGRGINAGFRKVKVWATGRKPLTRRVAVKNYNNSLQASDNITNAPAFKVGKPRTITFEEKIERIANPPLNIKRVYAWSAEASSGRKGMFGIPINRITSGGVTYGDLYTDAISSQQRLTTDSSTTDPTINYSGQNTIGRVYVDYMSEKLQMINSSTNSLQGTLTLYAYRRDCDQFFTNVNVPMTPINLMMHASNDNRSLYAPLGNDDTVGNGFKFDNVTAGVNYLANYDAPGSSLNTGGATAQVDPSLKILSSHVKEFTGYYFKEINKFDFSLKPGQQINHCSIFNDLPDILRQHTDMYFIKGISFYMVVEFQGQIVGDSTVNNVISTGSCQLSCILTEKRVLGHRGRNNKGKLYMPTPPLAGILAGAQYTINPDTGMGDIGEEEDA